MSDLAQALMVAIKVHAGQTDKQDQPYLLHVLRVVEAVSDKAKVVAALHDVLEDGGDDAKRLVLDLDLMGYEGRVLGLLTRDPRERYVDYIARLADEGATTWTDQNAILLAREVKLADVRDNLGRIPTDNSGKESPWASLKARYEKALATLENAGATLEGGGR